ncbi:MAG: desulfoferrodoxin family protein [Desulfosarcinaceae bacterium]
MDRRQAIKTAICGGGLLIIGAGQALAEVYYPVKVDENLWQGINRTKNPSQETILDKLHSPVIQAPEKVKAGEVFTVDVTIGQVPHPMGPTHWIEHLQFNVGNEPAGNIIFRSRGYVKAAGKFNALLGNALKGRTVSLIVQIKCNLHGIWQNHANVEVV